jgi:hypothetical protein
MREWHARNRERLRVERLERRHNDPKYKAQVARWMAAKRERVYEKVNAIKIESGCVDCGYDTNPVALQFDHVRGEKITEVGRLVRDRAPWERIAAEIEKCEVRCANCHSIKTWGR